MVAAEVGYDYVYPYLTEKCLNICDLLDDPDPIGKEYVLSFDKGTTATVIIESKETDGYSGTGIVNGYMKEPGLIRIDVNDANRVFIFFNKKSIDPLQSVFNTYYFPIPLDKWGEWESKRLAKAFRVEAEFKTLRLPYMI